MYIVYVGLYPELMKSSTWEPFVLQIADQILQQRMRLYDQVALHPARIPLPCIWCPNRFP